jgi:hypothetical protein
MVTVYRVRYLEGAGATTLTGNTLRFTYHATLKDAEKAAEDGRIDGRVFPTVESRKVEVVTEWSGHNPFTGTRKEFREKFIPLKNLKEQNRSKRKV